MKIGEPPQTQTEASVTTTDAEGHLEAVFEQVDVPAARNTWHREPNGVVVGTLLALTDNGRTALVTYPEQVGTGAIRSRTTVDLHGAHIGGHVVLMLEGGDANRPIVIGVLRDREGWPLEERPGHVDVTADGERLLVTAKDQLVLRCGKASITLTNAGKVIIEGTYVVSRSTGTNRIKGGSVQLN